MKALFFAVVLILTWCGSASAQSGYTRVTSCNDPTPPIGNSPGYMDLTGHICTAASVSASIAVAPLASTNLSSTIAVTNTFQSVQVSTAGRNGCAVQNNDTNTMWVFFGAIGGATKAKSVVLAAGQSVACAVGGIGVLTDQISITGTATGVFFAAVQ